MTRATTRRPTLFHHRHAGALPLRVLMGLAALIHSIRLGPSWDRDGLLWAYC